MFPYTAAMDGNPVSRRVYDRLKSTGEAPKPEYAMVELTLRCNLKCRMCYQSLRRGGGQKDLSTEEITGMIDGILGFGLRRRDFRLWGGECFMRDDIFDIISHLQERDCTLHIITNGTLITPRVAERLGEFRNIRSVMVSLDGLAATHDRIRGAPGAFEKTYEGIRLLSGGRFTLSVMTVLQKENLAEIEAIVRLCAEADVDHEFFIPEFRCTRAELDETSRMLGLPDETWTFLSEGGDDVSRDQFIGALDEVRRSGRREGMFTYYAPPVLRRFPGEFHSGAIRERVLGLTCSNLQKLMVDSRGDVVLCPFMPKTFGNLVSGSLDDIWNSEDMRSARRKLACGNMSPLCKRCMILDSVRG